MFCGEWTSTHSKTSDGTRTPWSRTLILATWILSCGLVLTVHCYLVTGFRFEFISKDSFGSVWDSLGAHLLRGEVNVDFETIGWEGFPYKDKIYQYQGLVPAVIRIVLNYFYPE